MNNHCIDCGKPIGRHSTRCVKCSNKHIWITDHDGRTKYITPEYRKLVSINTTRQWANDTDNKLHTTISKAIKKKWEDPTFRQHRHDCAIREMNDPTSKTYIGMVAATNERWADPTFKKFMSDTATISTTRRWKTKKYRNIMIKSVRKQWYTTNSKLRESIRTSNKHFRPSSLELKFKVMLDEVGILYKQQYRPYDYNRFYDFFLVDYDTLIEIDGYHWHHSEWAISRGSPVSDAEKDEWAVTHGFDMVRIPEKYVVPTIVKEWLVPKVLGITL